MHTKTAVLGLAMALLLAALVGCGGGDDKNAANTNAAATNAAKNTAATAPAPASSDDAAIKASVEANLKAKYISGVTVEVKDGVVTLTGKVASTDELIKARQAADEAKPKPKKVESAGLTTK